MRKHLLAQLLSSAEVKQSDLAQHLGVTRAAVNAWVHGERPIPAERVADIVSLLDLDAGQAAELYQLSGVHLPAVLRPEVA